MELTIQHVEVHVSSTEAAKEFYVDKLGLEILEDNVFINLLALKAGEVRISIFGGFTPDLARDESKASTHFVFRTYDIEKTYEQLTSKGIVFKAEIAEAPGFVKYLVTADPDGNVIEFGEYLRDPLAKRT